MIDYDKYKGHEKEHMSVASRKGSWDWVVYITENPNLEICQMFHDGIDEFNSKGEATAHLFADAPLILARLKDVEEENAALIHDNEELASLLGECIKYYVPSDALVFVEECNQALNKAKGGSK